MSADFVVRKVKTCTTARDQDKKICLKEMDKYLHAWRPGQRDIVAKQKLQFKKK